MVVLCLLGCASFSWSASKNHAKKLSYLPTPTPQIVKRIPTPIPSPTRVPSPTVAAALLKNSSSVDAVFAEVLKNMDERPSTPNSTTAKQLITNTPGKSMGKYLGEMLMSLAFVILLALGLAWGAKRYLIKKRTLGGEHIDLLATYTLSQKSQIHLVRVGEEFFLIGEGGSTLSLISQINLPAGLPPAVATPKSAPVDGGQLTPSFSERLSQWHTALQNRNLQQEVKTSLLLLGGLSKRLQKKGNGES